MSHSFSPEGRIQALEDMAAQKFDMLIIGGGITGAGLARDAALRGLKVALVEKEDFGFGTSSRSAKLVHGGLRYLAKGDIKTVRESARERKVLKTIAPHLVHPLPFVFPLYKGESKAKIKTGLLIFDKMAGASKEERHKVLTSNEVREYAPNLRDPLKGGLVFGEYITEDARLTLMNALSAAEHGAVVANHAEASSIRSNENGQVIGASIRDTLIGKTFNIEAKITVNATGPWAQQTLEENNFKATKSLLLSKGIHLIFPAEKIPITGAVSLKSSDGKEGYAIRRWDYVYMGTTDIPHEEEIDSPKADSEAIEFLLDMTRNCFPGSGISKKDILGTWAGVRPLILEEGKSARDTSRHDEVWKTKEGLFTVAGGKLTTYRVMGKRVMNEVAKALNLYFDEDDRTAEVVLPGGDIGEDFSSFKQEMENILSTYHIKKETAERLTWLYGSAINDLIRYGQEDPVWLERLNEHVPAIKGEVRLAVEKEMAQTLIDFMDRRAALLLFGNSHSIDAAKTAAEIMAQYLGWDEAEIERQINSYTDHIDRNGIISDITKSS
ncbi:glycerol-3-phosphate dehydrogenase/oxidase [Virgibacillus natechei]|uniref:glycerol-3-phosphate dehydrogenase/oxidase n=1 Tax=Virgibacillus sp. CBA3643 TaxID=2942278 RepID=UPI0035A34AC0